MNDIPASKIVFILMAIAVIGGLFTDYVDPKDFQTLAAMAFAFYFVTPSATGGNGLK